MATLLLAVILVSGFIYVNLSLSTRYRYKRSNGWDAYFFVAARGIGFFLLGGFFTFILNVSGGFRWLANALNLTPDSFNGMLSSSKDKLQRINEIKQIAWVMISIVLAAISGFGNKLRTSRGDRRWDALAKAVGNNAFESLLMEASARQFPIIATLSSRKIYVGLVTCPALENGLSEHLELLPMLSGYRDKDDLTISITTNYHQHYLDSGVISGMSRLSKISVCSYQKMRLKQFRFLILRHITNLKKMKPGIERTVERLVVKVHLRAASVQQMLSQMIVHDYAA